MLTPQTDPVSQSARAAAEDAIARLFGRLERDELEATYAAGEWVQLSRGELLLRQGERGDAVYVLVTGRLQALREDAGAPPRIVGQIAAGESVGETAFFTSEPRGATVCAVRDSVLLRFSGERFDRMLEARPRVLRSLMSVVMGRLQRANRAPVERSRVATVAVVPLAPGVALHAFATRLAAALGERGPTAHLRSGDVPSELRAPPTAPAGGDLRTTALLAWLSHHEAAHRFVVFEADAEPTEWSGSCVRQADWILAVAEADGEGEVDRPSEFERRLLTSDRSTAAARRVLALVHADGGRLPAGTKRWLEGREFADHVHVRWDRGDDFARLARLMDGAGVGLVLGGGGARSFAHIGVLRALQEAGVPIDMVAGTSMGAAIAAQHALGWTPEKMVEVNRHVWIERRPHREVTLPLVSLVGNRGATACGRLMYGDAQIEDLWVPFFCISSNLTRAEMVVHRTGPLISAVTASSSIPGFAVPVLQGRDLLVDGALFNNLPGDVMRSLGCGRLVVSNIAVKEDHRFFCDRIPSNREIVLSSLASLRPGRSGRPVARYPSLMEVVMRSVMLNTINHQGAVLRDADLAFDPPVDEFGLLDFPSLERIAASGYAHAKERLAAWSERGAFAA